MSLETIESGALTSPLLIWPPRSPDLTPMDFCINNEVKGKCYYIPYPADRIDLGSKNCYSFVTYTHELPMG